MAEANSNVTPRAGTWFTQNGAVIIDYRGKSDVTLDGAPAPGAAAIPNNDLTLGNGYGYYLTDDISVQLVLGRGPTTNVTDGAGTKLGEMWYGAPSLVLDYNFTQFGALQPFVGAGVSYIVVFDEEDGFIQNLEIDSTFGFILRAGAQVMLESALASSSQRTKSSPTPMRAASSTARRSGSPASFCRSQPNSISILGFIRPDSHTATDLRAPKAIAKELTRASPV